jgi:DHA2 family multidrug resistance protein
MALFSITATFAPAIGPTVGGYLTELFHWPVLFYLNIAPGLLLLAASLYAIDPEPRRLELLKNADKWGIATMAVGLSSLTIFLEEGERNDWFGSPFIVVLFVLAVVFITAFLVVELKSKNPFINLRLLMRRNFGLGSLANFVVGMALYGALYLLPTYLSTIQNYNSINIGKTMMWAGFPQLLILPFLPKLMQRFDSRWMAFLGVNIFAVSCLMNSRMTALVGLDQLMWSQIVRAMGQPILMVPLSTITIGLIEKEQAGSASGLFNMLRNLGGSVGIAVLSTFLTVREQFHSARLGEAVSMYNLETQQRVQTVTEGFVFSGSDVVTALHRALGVIDFSIRKEATVMAYNDCFFFVAVALFCSSALILLCKKVGAQKGPSEAH